MYRITLLAMVFLFGLVARAQDKDDKDPNAIIIEMKDGTSVSYLFWEFPELSFTDKDLVVTTPEYEVAHPQNSIQRYVFGWVEDASVESPKVDNMLQIGNQVVVSNLSKGDVLSVYGINGALLKSTKAGVDGHASLSIEELDPGVYLVKYKDTTVKIQKL